MDGFKPLNYRRKSWQHGVTQAGPVRYHAKIQIKDCLRYTSVMEGLG